VKAPVIPSGGVDAAQPVNSLIERVRAQEAKEARHLRKARPLWLIATAMFLFVFAGLLLQPSATVRPARLVFCGVLAAVYVVNAALLARRLRALSRIDYADSPRSFLQSAEPRHRFMGPRELWLAGSGLVILGVVTEVYVEDMLLQRYVAPEHQALGIAVYCLGYLLVCAAGFMFSYLNWMRDTTLALEMFDTPTGQRLESSTCGICGKEVKFGPCRSKPAPPPPRTLH